MKKIKTHTPEQELIYTRSSFESGRKKMHSVIETQNTQESKSHIQKNRQKDMKPKRWEKFIISSNFLNYKLGTSLVVECLRLCASQAGGPGSVPGQGTPERSRVQPKIICKVCNQDASKATTQSSENAMGNQLQRSLLLLIQTHAGRLFCCTFSSLLD